MEIYFQDPSEIPLPPEEVRIRKFTAELWPDGRRVRVYVEVDPFQKRPNVDLTIRNAQGEEEATASIIESMERKMELTMHLRRPRGEGGGSYSAEAVLFYTTQEANEAGELAEPVHRLIDRSAINFEIR